MRIAAFDDNNSIEIILHNGKRQIVLGGNLSQWVAIDEHGERKTGPIVNAATVNELLTWLERGGPLP